jgi:hypothetical protein
VRHHVHRNDERDALRYTLGMVRIDPALERIAARLTAADLRADSGDTSDLFEDDERPFVDVYSVTGLRRVLQEYGLDEALRRKGLGDHTLRITREDDFRHRLELVLSDGQPVMDMRLHLREAAVTHGDPVAVVVVDWLLMQHPRQTFSAERPQLPGQRHPGTGLGRIVHGLLVLLCRRLGRDGLVTVPERFHLAALYRRLGYRAADVDMAADADVVAVMTAANDQGVSFVALAWAVERGLVFDDDGRPWRYAPHTRFCPVSARLERVLTPTPSTTSTTSMMSSPPTPHFHIDVDGLRRSLADDPVEGLTTIG